MHLERYRNGLQFLGLFVALYLSGGGFDEGVLVILGGVQRLELMLLYQGLQLDGIFTDHGGISNRKQSKV